jgi:hypothetical protein
MPLGKASTTSPSISIFSSFVATRGKDTAFGGRLLSIPIPRFARGSAHRSLLRASPRRARAVLSNVSVHLLPSTAFLRTFSKIPHSACFPSMGKLECELEAEDFAGAVAEAIRTLEVDFVHVRGIERDSSSSAAACDRVADCFSAPPGVCGLLRSHESTLGWGRRRLGPGRTHYSSADDDVSTSAPLTASSAWIYTRSARTSRALLVSRPLALGRWQARES